MILSGHQPVYLPSILLFNKIALSDTFMFVGHCKATPGSWHTRNLVRGATLSIPVKNDFGVSINDTEFAGDRWKHKHFRSIEFAYGKTPYFDLYWPKLKQTIQKPWDRLGPMNMALIEQLCIYFNIDTEITESRKFPYHDWGHKTEMLWDMCMAVDADHYLSNQGSRPYVDENSLAIGGVTHCWQGFKHPIYDQHEREFISNLSAIDILFNLGPEAGKEIKHCGTIL